MGRFSLQWIDSTSERVSVSYEVPDAAADGTDYAAQIASNLTFRDALLAVQIAPALKQQNYVSTRSEFSPSIPANPLNQAEQRWIVEYQVDGLSGLYRAPIPCADLSQGTPQNGVVTLDTSVGNGATLKTQFESRVISQDGIDAGGTGAVTVTRVYAESS